MTRICVITAGHLATCPRMLKAADALADAGHSVHAVCTRHVDWAAAADASVRRTRAWQCTVVDYGAAGNRSTYLRSGLRQRAARLLARAGTPRRSPMTVVVRAYSRVHTELVEAALAAPTDLYYGGTAGALAAVAAAARRAGVPYALDLEDFHTAEQDDAPAARFVHRLAERVEHDVLPDAAFLTASSDAIAAAYTDKYGVHPIVIHNTFPLPQCVPPLNTSPAGRLRLCWFSQTIGPRRGVEDAVHAMGQARIPGELHLRGRPIPQYLDALQRLVQQVAPALTIVHHDPCDPDQLIALCRGYDVGLAIEPGFSHNNRIAASNKAFTYLLAGLAVALTDTPGQRPLAHSLGEGALLYAPGDVTALAHGLARWAHEPALLARAKVAAWQAAQRRWHWEHPAERGALLHAVAQVVGGDGAS